MITLQFCWVHVRDAWGSSNLKFLWIWVHGFSIVWLAIFYPTLDHLADWFGHAMSSSGLKMSSYQYFLLVSFSAFFEIFFNHFRLLKTCQLLLFFFYFLIVGISEQGVIPSLINSSAAFWILFLIHIYEILNGKLFERFILYICVYINN